MLKTKQRKTSATMGMVLVLITFIMVVKFDSDFIIFIASLMEFAITLSFFYCIKDLDADFDFMSKLNGIVLLVITVLTCVFLTYADPVQWLNITLVSLINIVLIAYQYYIR